MSSAVHLLAVLHPGGSRSWAVLRRYVRPELNAEEPDIASREASVLRFAETAGLPAPRLLAADTTGAGAVVPAVLMSRLPGRVDWWPADAGRWLRGLAAVLPRIHAAPLPAAGMIRAYAPDVPGSCQPPAWARHPQVWERAAGIVHGPPPGCQAVFIHRDYHPGNVLWRRGAVSGVVDWQAASLGPAVADVGHCRVNLLRFGPASVARFTRLWEEVAGDTYHPWADVVTIIGFLDDLREDGGSDRFLLEDMLARAVADLAAGP
jgi:aminoglycoside phosphotransferase (APT) family kinase protein